MNDTTHWAQAYVGLGANLGDPADTLRAAATELAARRDIRDFRLSRLVRSAPVDSCGPDYINAVAAFQTQLRPAALLTQLQAVETRHGRQRPWRNAPRTLDLDLLWYDGLAIDEPGLIVPHPRMHLRAFVLLPLSELSPALTLPQGTLPELLAKVADQRVDFL